MWSGDRLHGFRATTTTLGPHRIYRTLVTRLNITLRSNQPNEPTWNVLILKGGNLHNLDVYFEVLQTNRSVPDQCGSVINKIHVLSDYVSGVYDYLICNNFTKTNLRILESKLAHFCISLFLFLSTVYSKCSKKLPMTGFEPASSCVGRQLCHKDSKFMGCYYAGTTYTCRQSLKILRS